MTTAYTGTEQELRELHARFVAGYTEWFCEVYCRNNVPNSHHVIADQIGYGNVYATWADFAEPDARFADYMRSWLNEDDEEPGEWDNDWQRQYDMYTR